MESESVKIAHEREEAFNAGDWDRFLGLYAESIVVHAPGSPEPMKGREGVRQWLRSFVSGFSDLKSKVRHAFGEGEWVVVVEEITGTHTGTFIGADGSEILATNKPIHLWSADVLRVENGQITEQHAYFDILAMMSQLGLVPRE